MALKIGQRAAAFVSAGLAVFGVQDAQAETLDVGGVYAANIDLPGDIQTIVIDTIQGEIGADAELAIQQVLGAASVDGAIYYRVLRADAPMTGSSVTIGNQESVRSAIAPDAILSGVVRANVIERRLDPRIRKECVERDDDGDCTTREEFPIPCREMTVQILPRMLMIGETGEQLYSNNETLFQAARYCREDTVIPSALDITDALIDELASNIRFDLAPVERFEAIRIMESRKDLAREDRDAFREAVRLTKDDQAASCDGFTNLEERNPMQVSVLFNIGLCHEVAGELEAAIDYYNRALGISPGRDSPTQGLRRIASRQRAAIQMAAREQAFSKEPAQ